MVMHISLAILHHAWHLSSLGGMDHLLLDQDGILVGTHLYSICQTALLHDVIGQADHILLSALDGYQ